MAGTWPNLDHSDMNTRLRTYLDEVTANFYSNAELARWLSIAARDVAQKANCVRRILDAKVVSGERNVTPYGSTAAEIPCYKVHHVEYIPSSGRTLMLPKISPLQVGHYPLSGTTPQYWYEFGNYVGIDPLVGADYNLRLYVSDIPKIVYLDFSGAGAFTEGVGATQWTDSGTGWTGGNNATHAGSGTDTFTYNTAFASANTNITFRFTVSGIASGGTVTPYAGGTAGLAVATNGYHTQTIAATTPWTVILSATQTIVIDDLYVYKEVDFASGGTEQIEMGSAWQNLIILSAFAMALKKDRKYAQANMVESIVRNEIDYLRQNIVEVIPDGQKDIVYQ